MESETIRTIESQIMKAWKDTGKEFSSTRNPKCVFWTEQASLKHPFYFNLRRRLDRSGISQGIMPIPEYSPEVPGHAVCGIDNCNCGKTRKQNKQIHIDLCLVEFEDKIRRSNIEEDSKYHNMWCYKPHPIVAIEFKYPYKYDERLFDEDIEKLLIMQNVYKAKLLYMCFATYRSDDIRKALDYIKQKIKHSSSKNNFWLAAGTLKKNDWRIHTIK